MELCKPPFTRDSFSHGKEYYQAKHDFYNEEYKGRIVRFEHELVTISGNINQEKHKAVVITAYECGFFKVSELSGVPIYGLFKPSAFTEDID